MPSSNVTLILGGCTQIGSFHHVCVACRDDFSGTVSGVWPSRHPRRSFSFFASLVKRPVAKEITNELQLEQVSFQASKDGRHYTSKLGMGGMGYKLAFSISISCKKKEGNNEILQKGGRIQGR